MSFAKLTIPELLVFLATAGWTTGSLQLPITLPQPTLNSSLCDATNLLVPPTVPLSLIIDFCAAQQSYTLSTYIAFFRGIMEEGVVNRSLINTVNSVYNELGQGECSGLYHQTGLTTAQLIYHVVTGGQGDLAGYFLCSQQCPGGTCEPYEDVNQAPISGYPFGCNCPSGACDANGPKANPNFLNGTAIVCTPNSECDCSAQDPDHPGATGYLCNWWNLKLNSQIYYYLPTELSPIRWCTCCE